MSPPSEIPTAPSKSLIFGVHMATPFGQSHNSLNGGWLGHGGTELRLAPPPDADTLVPDPPLDVDTPVDDRPDP
jgi:hypothetical protein